MSLSIKDGLGVTKLIKTTLTGGEYIPHHHVDSLVGTPMFESGITELIGANDAAIATNAYSKSVGVPLGGTFSGRIKGLTLVMRETGTGAIITEAGKILILDADPSVSAADAALAANGLEHRTVIGTIAIADADWVEDASGAVNFKQVDIPFHSLANLYFVYLHQGATSINDAAGDDEILEFNVWYERSA